MLMDRIPTPVLPTKRRRRHPCIYPDQLLLKAPVIMMVRHLHTVHELLAVHSEPTDEIPALRALLVIEGRFPTRRTRKRRLQALPAALPAQIGCLGRYRMQSIQQ